MQESQNSVELSFKFVNYFFYLNIIAFLKGIR